MTENKENNDLTLYEIQVEKQRNEEQKAIELLDKKKRINNTWCDYMSFIFEKYQNESIETELILNETTLDIFQKNGIETMGKTVYECFDNIISSGKHIEDYLSKQRGKYSETMPF